MRSGDRVRITAQLIDARSDTHLWADTYERNVRGHFGLAGRRGAANRYSGWDQPDARRSDTDGEHPVVNSAAQEAYLKGRYHWNQRTEAGLRAGIKYFQKPLISIRLSASVMPASPIATS